MISLLGFGNSIPIAFRKNRTKRAGNHGPINSLSGIKSSFYNAAFSPSISVLKSSVLSDHLIPPLETLPPLRWIPSNL